MCRSLCGSGFFKGWAFCCMMGILSDFIAVGGIDVAGFGFLPWLMFFCLLGALFLFMWGGI
ncbi:MULTISPECIES: hypothetical protein [unclassified Bartonella]|uniref:hypothetical protein n=1 Tax=unclassified Bartonella TaxID=2645622 RepID=UPI0035D10CFB